MKTEQEIEKLFTKYRNALILKLNRKPLTTDIINRECKNLFQAKFAGCYAQNDSFPIKNGKYYIINTDTKEGPGEHWISVILTPTRVYVYDSFARSPKKIVPLLMKRFKNKKVIYDTKDKEQTAVKNGKQTVICGHSSIAFLKIAHELGIRAAMKI